MLGPLLPPRCQTSVRQQASASGPIVCVIFSGIGIVSTSAYLFVALMAAFYPKLGFPLHPGCIVRVLMAHIVIKPHHPVEKPELCEHDRDGAKDRRPSVQPDKSI